MTAIINFLATSGSVPFSGMTSTFDVICNKTGTLVGPDPAIQELVSSGQYVFSGSDYQETMGVGFLLRHQSGSDVRFSAGSIGSSSVFFSLYDGSSTPIVGATPVLTSLSGLTGDVWAPFVPKPSITDLGNALYTFPVSADMITKKCKFMIWSSSSAVFPEYQAGSIEVEATVQSASLNMNVSAFNEGLN